MYWIQKYLCVLRKQILCIHKSSTSFLCHNFSPLLILLEPAQQPVELPPIIELPSWCRPGGDTLRLVQSSVSMTRVTHDNVHYCQYCHTGIKHRGEMCEASAVWHEGGPGCPVWPGPVSQSVDSGERVSRVMSREQRATSDRNDQKPDNSVCCESILSRVKWHPDTFTLTMMTSFSEKETPKR